MKRFWEWLQENSAALQGVASAVVIIGALIAVPTYLKTVFSPDLVFRLNVDTSTVPPDLIAFSNNVSRLFAWEKEAFEDLKEKSDELNILLKDPVIKRLESTDLKLDKAQLEIINQSQRVISGIRVRLDNVYSLWGFEVAGTFLENAEAEGFREKLKGLQKEKSLVLPELPQLPPHSSIVLTIYGDLDILSNGAETS